MTREEAVKEIEKVFEPAFANYIITTLTEGRAYEAGVKDGLEQEPTTKNDIRYNRVKNELNRVKDELEPKPMVEIDLYSVIKQSYIEREVLDKIRAEIVDLGRRTMNDNRASGIWACRDILDKYKAESEGV